MSHCSELQGRAVVSEAGTLEAHEGPCLVPCSVVTTGGTLDWMIPVTQRGSQTTMEAEWTY